ncbi:hypothetical protein GE061_006422 [Apolygus lucorum]|uniref:Uncharacterized protein n=1 Tax=Apolygus lucorum TaxID=248454 RepID=A0A6A4JHU1_APOLU|nr:hypothetical protein GE061_006422 [Apolygus lucorum]
MLVIIFMHLTLEWILQSPRLDSLQHNEYEVTNSPDLLSEFGDFVILNVDEDENSLDRILWSREKTVQLIQAYRAVSPKLGSFEIKRKKQMWEVIARLVGNGTANQCENKWKVLIRGYKNIIDHNKKTGRDRWRNHEYAEYLDPIFANKKNINPEIVLTSSSVIRSAPDNSAAASQQPDDLSCFKPVTPSTRMLPATPSTPRPTTPTLDEIDVDDDLENHPKRKKGSRISVLEQIRLDKKKYHDEMVSIHQRRLNLEKQRLEELKMRNEILREKNRLLAEMHCKK